MSCQTVFLKDRNMYSASLVRKWLITFDSSRRRARRGGGGENYLKKHVQTGWCGGNKKNFILVRFN
jgi:hypothetical protein